MAREGDPGWPRLGDVRLFESQASRRRFVLHLSVVTLLLVATFVVAHYYLPWITNAGKLRQFVRGFGVLGPLVLIGFQALQVVLAPVPGQVLAVVAGYLYGAWWGTLYNMVGITIGTTVAFWLARRFGRPYVERIVHDGALDSFDAFAEDHALAGLFVVFLVPGLPDDVICFFGGLTKLPMWQLVAVAIVGRTPAFFLVNWVGASFQSGQVGLALTLLGLVLGLSFLGYHYRDWLLARFER